MRRIDAKRNISASKAVETLRGYGTKISEEDAGIILDFMYKMSRLTVENFTKSKVKTGSSAQE